jgi:DNA-binding winged helix-turn-helix (wHTH) protein/class 3 adenylate cyclase/tetratricopeptide (TPR) repeat protein
LFKNLKSEGFRLTSFKLDGNGEISFGRFRLCLQRRELSYDGCPIRLRRRSLDLLCALASAKGELVSKDELMERLWPGRAVEEGNLHVHVSALRRALGENGEGHSYVVTAPGRGYRLAGLGGFELAGLGGLTSQNLPSPKNQATGSDGVADPGSDASGPARVLERRQLTVISAELIGAAQLATLLEPEDLTATLTAVYHYCSEIITRFGGGIIRLVGGVILGHLGYPQAGEHDAEQAIRASLAIIDGIHNFEAAGKALQFRVGISTGPVVVADLVDEGSSDTSGLFGETINLAEALQRAAEPSTVVVADNTRRLVGDLFDLRRRDLAAEGFDEPVEVYKVLCASSVDSRFQALHGLRLIPLIGREEEIELLLRRWQRTKSRELRVVLITGEPGIGKSRLCVELQERIGREPHSCLRYFCSPHHQESALYPVTRQIEVASRFERGDASDVRLIKLRALLARETAASEWDIDLLADMLSLADSRSPSSVELTARRRREFVFEALVRQLEALSLRRPVLMVLEDAHWSDPTTLELVDLVLRRVMQRPVLVLVTFRADFAVPWTGQSHVTTLTLGRLDRRDSAALVRRVVGNDTLGNGVVEAIVERTDGVPLFIEELSKALVESNTTVGAASGVQWPLMIPMTLQASLMARLDRLPHGKRVAQIGAVIGRVFQHALLAEVCNMPEAQLGQGLRELIAAGLVNVHGLPPEATYTFKHVLVQETAYESLLKSRRAESHAAVVAACERISDFNIEPGVLAHHCAQASVIGKAAFYYRMAAEQSIVRAAITETRMQLQHGLEFAANLPEGLERDELEAELLLALAIVLQTTDSMSNAEAGQLFSRAADVSRNSARPQLLCRALWGQFTSVLVRGEVLEARALAEELLDLAQSSDEMNMQIAARAAIGIALYYQGHFDDAREHLTIQQAVLESQFEEADLDWRTTTAGPAFLALTLACLGYQEQAMRQLDRAVEFASRRGSFALAYSLSITVRVLIVLRNEEGLREHAARLVALSEEGGFDQFRNQGLCALGWLEARMGASQQGLEKLRKGLTGMLDRVVLLAGLPFYRSLLVDAQSEDECRRDNIATLDQALDLSGHIGDIWFTAELHRRRGELLAGLSSDPTTAETELYGALAIAREQSAKLFELRAAMSLARLLAIQGKRVKARKLLVPVYDFFTEGFGTPDLQEARLLLDELARSPRRSPRQTN